MRDKCILINVQRNDKVFIVYLLPADCYDYITSQQRFFSQINTRQTCFEAYFDSKRKSRDCSALYSVTVFYKTNVIFCIERHLKKPFTVIITVELTNSSWHLYQKCFVVSLDNDDFTFIAHAQ